MTCRIKIAICIAILFITNGCAQMRSGISPTKVISSTNKKHEMYFGMARIAERNGKTESARKAYLQILDQDPAHVDSLHRMAVTSVKTESLDEALDYFEQAIQLTEPTADLLADFGYALYLDEDFEAAENALTRARELLPDDPRVANNLALVLGRQGKYDEAYELFQQSGGRAEALANLAFVQSQAGDISYAKKNYHQALGIDPTLAVAANGLYEIHNAFPDHDSMLIKPFRERADAHPERLVTKDGSADDIDQLIRAISIKPGNRSSSLKADHVVPASYQAPIDRRLPIAERDFEEPNLQKSQSHPVGISSAPQRAENIKAKRIPTQSGSSSRRAESSVRSSDSSNR